MGKKWFSAIVLLAMSTPGAAPAMEVSWQVPLYASLPSAQFLGDQVVVRNDFGDEQLVLGIGHAPPGGGSGPLATRIVAVDARDGSLRWQSELNEACALPLQDFSLTAIRLTALANGDIGVALGADRSMNILSIGSVCHARIAASDGRIMWARTDFATTRSESLVVRSIASFGNGDLAISELHGRRGRTARLSELDGRVLWMEETDFQYAERPEMELVQWLEVDPANDNVVLLGSGDGVRTTPVEMRSLDGRTGRVLWRKTWCPGLYWTGRLSPIHGRGVAYSFECGTDVSQPMDFTFGIATDSGPTSHPAQFVPGRNPTTIRHSPSGDPLLVGDFLLDGVRTAFARFSANDGRLQWSAPGSIGGPDGKGAVSNVHVTVTADDLFVWELIGSASMYPLANTTRLSRLDLRDGRLVGQRDMPLASSERLHKTAGMRSLPDGSLVLAGLSQTDKWVLLARLRPDLEAAWMRREPAGVDRYVASNTIRENADASPLLVPVSSGPRGVLVATLAPSELFAGQPTVFRLGRDDGRRLWEWKPQDDNPHPVARLDAFISDGSSQAYLSGVFRQDPERPFLARIDVSSGNTVWQVQVRALSLFQNDANTLYAADDTALSRISTVDGRIVWRAEFAAGARPDSALGLVAGPDGNPVVALPVLNPWGDLRVIKLRAADGIPLWSTQWRNVFDKLAAVQLVALPDGDIVSSAPVARLHGSTGEIAWRRGDLSSDGVMVSAYGSIAFRNARVDLSAPMRLGLDATTGETRWSERLSALESRYPSLPLAFDRSGNPVVVDAMQDSFRVRRIGMNAASEELARIAIPTPPPGTGKIYSPAPTDLAVGTDGSIYFLAEMKDGPGQVTTATVSRFGGGDPLRRRPHDTRPLPPPAWRIPPRHQTADTPR